MPDQCSYRKIKVSRAIKTLQVLTGKHLVIIKTDTDQQYQSSAYKCISRKSLKIDIGKEQVKNTTKNKEYTKAVQDFPGSGRTKTSDKKPEIHHKPNDTGDIIHPVVTRKVRIF